MKRQAMIMSIMILAFMIVILGVCSNNNQLGRTVNMQNTEHELGFSRLEQEEMYSETEVTIGSEFFEETETEDAEQRIEKMCEKVRSMDFTVNESHMDVTPEENQMYLEAYLKILKNEMSVYDVSGEQEYYRDLWRTGIEFEDLIANKAYRDFPYLYYYDDLDGDGRPEFATNQGCLVIYNYELGEDFSRVLYSGESCYFKKIVGAGQIWEHDGQHAGVIRDYLVLFGEENHGENIMTLQEGLEEPPFYEISVEGYDAVDVGKENWDELTAPFFDMVENHEIPKLTLEEVFGDLLETE